MENFKTKFIPRWKVTLITGNPIEDDGLSEDIYFGKGLHDGFVDPLLLRVEKNVKTTSEDHFQVTVNIVKFVKHNNRDNLKNTNVDSNKTKRHCGPISPCLMIFK